VKAVKSDVHSLRDEMQAEFKKIDARFEQMNSQMNSKFEQMNSQMNSKFEQMNSQMNSKFEQINATNQRMLALLEEQNSRNKASFEGAEMMRVQQEEVIKRVDALEDFQLDISKRLKTN
jgi:hypothetical protein